MIGESNGGRGLDGAKDRTAIVAQGSSDAGKALSKAATTIDTRGYDFIDFGPNKGGSMRLASAAFGGVGLGVDYNPDNVDAVRERGFHAVVADATKVALEPNCVRFCQAFHFLEHLPNRRVAEQVLDNAVYAAQDFVLAIGPDFSGHKYLADFGLMKYFAAFPDHTWQHTAKELEKMLARYDEHRWSLIQFGRIFDSWDSTIVPKQAYPKSSPRYDPQVHAPKEWIRFAPKLYEFVAFVIIKNRNIRADEVLYLAMKPNTLAQRDFEPLYERGDCER